MDERPIGYWLKTLDRLIDESFDRTIGDHGLARRHWQVLNTLAEAPVSEPDLVNALAPFLRDPTEIPSTIAGLVDRAWARASGNGQFELTSDGRDEYLRIRQRAQQTRALLVDGISPTEYHNVVDVLGRMARNLESAAS